MARPAVRDVLGTSFSRWQHGPFSRWRHGPRPRLVQEVFLVVAGYWLYNLAQSAAPLDAAMARLRGLSIYHAEQYLHLDPERWLNQVLVEHHWLATAADYYYALMHLTVTSAVLLWLYRRRPLRYRPARSVLYAASLIALVVFWIWPVAPPRLVPQLHLVDTALVNHAWFSYSSAGLESAANQFASMPSLHVAWALWAGVMLVRFARPVVVRAFGVVHPAVTSVVVLATANHYVLDLAGGVAVLLCGGAISLLLHRPCRAWRPARAGPHNSEPVDAGCDGVLAPQ